MARPLRIERAGGWYHVTARGNERREIYRDDRDRRHFIALVEEMVGRFRLRVHAYVLMNNHYHLMVELSEPNLSRAFQWLNVSYSVWFNRRHERSGHLFQGRFKSVEICPNSWGLELSRYVHLNPVRVQTLGLGKAERGGSRQGICAAPTSEIVRRRKQLLRDHRWSSYRAYVGLDRQPDWLECDKVLELGGGPVKERRRRYREYVEEAIREGLKASPWESLREQIVLGTQEFLEELKKSMSGGAGERERLERMMERRPDWGQVVRCVEQLKGEPWKDFRERHTDGGRDLVLHLARRLGGMTLNELARRAGLRGDSAVSMALRRYARRLARDPKEVSRMEKASQLLIVRS